MNLKLLSFTAILSILPALLPVQAGNALSLFSNKSTSQPQFLPANDAFSFSHIQQKDKLNIFWQIADGYYLYKDKVRITISGDNYNAPDLPQGVEYQDEYFGEVKIIKGQLILSIPTQDIASTANIQIQYQGCAAAGLCYPPMTQSITQTK